MVPYCESVIAGTSFSVNDLVYRSQGSISQADEVMPDSLGFVVLSNGSGSGTFFARSGSMAGIGSGSEQGYVKVCLRLLLLVDGLSWMVRWSGPRFLG